jgi:MFS transporter, DHA3 family, macrolide efflux protein
MGSYENAVQDWTACPDTRLSADCHHRIVKGSTPCSVNFLVNKISVTMNISKAFKDIVSRWRGVLKNRDVRWLYAGQLISQIGEGLSKVALLWFVYNTTESALKMTLVGVLQTVPPLVFGPFAGVLLDRLPKRMTMIVIDVARTGLLSLIPILYALGHLSLLWLYTLVFVIAMFSMAFGPTLNAALPRLVKKEQLVGINALMQSALTVGQLMGPALSGILIAAIGAQNVLYVNAGTFFVAALMMIPVKIPHIEAVGRWQHAWPQAVEDFRTGLRFIFIKQRLLLLLMVIASIFSFGSQGFVYLLPMIAEKILQVGSVGLGWLWSSLSIGFLLATVLVVVIKNQDICHRMLLMAGASAVGGGAALVLLLPWPFLIAAVFIAIIGISSGLLTPLVSASLQERTPHDLLARVFGIFNTGTMAFAMLGMTVLGWASDKFGASVSLMTIGSAQLGAAAFAAVLLPLCSRLAKESGSKSPASRRAVA